MSDDNKIVNQNTSPVVQADQTQPQIQGQPAVPAGSVNKEIGSVGTLDSEFVRPSEAEPQISQELKELGVEAKSDRTDLTFEHKGLIDHAGPHVPVSATPLNSIQYPMSEDEITDKLKTGQDDDSGKWLSKLIQKIMKAMGL